MSFTWTDDNIARLKELVAAGESYAAIAKDLGAPSRSAIAGKVLRLGIGDTRPKNEATPAPITAVNPRARTPHQVEAKIRQARSVAAAARSGEEQRVGIFCEPIEEVAVVPDGGIPDQRRGGLAAGLSGPPEPRPDALLRHDRAARRSLLPAPRSHRLQRRASADEAGSEEGLRLSDLFDSRAVPLHEQDISVRRIEHLAEGVTLMLGDCLSLIGSVAPVDHVISDPPYEDELHKAIGRIRRNDGREMITDLGFEGVNASRAEIAKAVVSAASGWAILFTLAEGVRAWRDDLRAGWMVVADLGPIHGEWSVLMWRCDCGGA